MQENSENSGAYSCQTWKDVIVHFHLQLELLQIPVWLLFSDLSQPIEVLLVAFQALFTASADLIILLKISNFINECTALWDIPIFATFYSLLVWNLLMSIENEHADEFTCFTKSFPITRQRVTEDFLFAT